MTDLGNDRPKLRFVFEALIFPCRYYFILHSLQSAIAWFLLYYLVLKPFKLLTIDDEHTERLRAVGLYSRFSFFEVLLLCSVCPWIWRA